MNILVLGGNRFFGKHLVQHLIADKHTVTILNRGKSKDDFGNSVKRIALDRNELGANTPELHNLSWDVVYDQICYDSSQARETCLAFQGKTKRYIFTSSQSVYTWGEFWKEDGFDPRKHSFEAKVKSEVDYAEAKRQAEATFFRLASFPVTVVRFPIVMGLDDYTERLRFHVERVKKQEPIYFPNLDARLSIINSSDAGRFLAFLASHPIEGSVNCCSPEPLHLRKMMEIVEGILRKPAIYADVETKENSSPYGIPNHWTMNSEKMRALGFSATPWQNWLPQLIETFSAG